MLVRPYMTMTFKIILKIDCCPHQINWTVLLSYHCTGQAARPYFGTIYHAVPAHVRLESSRVGKAVGWICTCVHNLPHPSCIFSGL